MDDYGLDVILCDATTHEEIPIRFRPKIAPAVGEEIHYWQDGTEDYAGGEAVNRHDWIVRRVSHDWRYMPSRHGGRALHVSVLVLFVEPFTPPAPYSNLSDEDLLRGIEGFVPPQKSDDF